MLPRVYNLHSGIVTRLQMALHVLMHQYTTLAADRAAGIFHCNVVTAIAFTAISADEDRGFAPGDIRSMLPFMSQYHIIADGLMPRVGSVRQKIKI